MVTYSSDFDHDHVEDGFIGTLNILNSNGNECVLLILQALVNFRIHLMEGNVPMVDITFSFNSIIVIAFG